MVNVSIFPVFRVLTDLFPGCQQIIAAETTFPKDNIYKDNYQAYNVLSQSQDFVQPGGGNANYWIAQDGKSEGQFFLVDLGCQQRIGGVKLINSRNNGANDRATNEFK